MAQSAAPPPGLAGWATETAADLQWAHAVAPAADLLLVTAHGTTDAELMQAVATARSFPRVSVVSMSFGRGEFPGQAAFDSVFTSAPGRGVSYVAASGDTAGQSQFLAYSPRVVGVGGTSLTTTDGGQYVSERPWRDGPAGSGGGFSQYAPAPGFQSGKITYPAAARGSRGAPDVSWVADKLWVYDRTSTAGPWLISSGTSLAAPLWAGLLALANQGRALGGKPSLDGPTQTLPLLYSAPPVALRDIADSSYPAAGPWDWTTGLGTPVVGPLLDHLLERAARVAVPPVEVPSRPVSPPTAPSVPPPPPAAAPPVTPPPAGVAVGRPGGLAATGSGWGTPGTVTGYDPDTGEELFQVQLYDDFTGGVRVAVVEDEGDGLPDVIAGQGPGGDPRLVLVDGDTGKPVEEFDTFERSFTGGVFVATGDLDGDGVADFVVTPDEGGGPRVMVISGRTHETLADFYGIDDAAFRGGARAAVGDLDGDGNPDLIVAAGYGGGPRVAVYDGRSIRPGAAPRRLVSDFFAMDPNLRNGLYVAAGDVFGRGRDDLLLGAGPGGAPRVLAVDGRSLVQTGRLTPLADFYAGERQNRGGAPVAVARLGDGSEEVLVGGGRGSGAARVFTPAQLTAGDTAGARQFVSDLAVAGGVYVG